MTNIAIIAGTYALLSLIDAWFGHDASRWFAAGVASMAIYAILFDAFRKKRKPLHGSTGEDA